MNLDEILSQRTHHSETQRVSLLPCLSHFEPFHAAKMLMICHLPFKRSKMRKSVYNTSAAGEKLISKLLPIRILVFLGCVFVCVMPSSFNSKQYEIPPERVYRYGLVSILYHVPYQPKFSQSCGKPDNQLSFHVM